MPEIKHTFQGGKMNKDLDERLVKNGEYRHAVNVQVRTTDSSTDGDAGAAGVVQNILGNTDIGNSYYDGTWMNQNAANLTEEEIDAFGRSLKPRCVASIADEKNDKAYFFFATHLGLPNLIDLTGETRRDYIDCIIEQHVDGTTSIVVVDKFATIDTMFNTVGSFQWEGEDAIAMWNEWDKITVQDISAFRVGMEIKMLNGDGINVLDDGLKIKAIDPVGNQLLLHEPQNINPITAGAQWCLAEAPRVLNFTPGAPGPVEGLVPPIPNTITGINIIDDLLFWTDSYSEPKKINITRCKAGTDENNTFSFANHTKLYIKNTEGDLIDAAVYNHNLDSSNIAASGLQQDGGGVNSDLKEEHITVIKKAPRTAPTLHMSRSDRPGTSNINVQYYFVNSVSNSTLEIGEIHSIQDSILIDSQFRKDDILEFTRNDSSATGVISFKVKFICYEDDEGNEVLDTTDKIRVEILTTSDVDVVDFNWTISLEQRKPLFELKLARFGYRYKYEDGEYSSFSPWSEIAFLPDRFEYNAGVAHNIGMINTVRELIIKDFIPYEIPLDVKAVDILYKTTDSPNVYVVETVEREKSPEWEFFTPDGDDETTSIKTGQLTITSEMIHRVLPANQLLRSWDNVPRYALAQEITGNRLVYGNYTQGYNIEDTINLTQSIVSENVDGIYPKKSIKTIRDYKIGMVFGDKYGRETPVITPGYTTIDNTDEGYSAITGDISLPKTLCINGNSFVVSQTWGNPNVTATPPLSSEGGWIDYVKYFVKETSNEYYNLIMDRWYDSGDNGTVWLSFNSADRNKVDEETHLILKNKHGSNSPVLEKARYKIIAIENEAPDYIKTKSQDLGKLIVRPEDTGDTMWTSAGSDETTGGNIGNLVNDNQISIDESTWNASVVGNTDSDDGIFGRRIDGRIKFRIIGRSNVTPFVQIESSWRTLSHYVSGEDASGAAIVTLHWADSFLIGDVDMAAQFTTLYDDGNLDYDTGDSTTPKLQYWLEFVEDVVHNKPEFDGKFFVKVKTDLTLLQNVQSTTTLTPGDMEPGNSYQLHYIQSTYENSGIQSDGMQTNPTTNQLVSATADFDGATTDSVAWFGGAFANFLNPIVGVTPTENDNTIFDNASVYTNTDNVVDDNFPSLTPSAGLALPTGFLGSALFGEQPFLPHLYLTQDILDATTDEGYTIAPGFWNQEDWYINDANYGVLANEYYPTDQFIYTQNGFGEEIEYIQSANTSETAFSPFGSCSENYNDMTIEFWENVYTQYGGAIETVGGSVNSGTGDTGVVFLDSTNMAKMLIKNGPHANTGIDSLQGGNDGVITTGPHGVVEGGYDMWNKYWKPINVFHKGWAKVNDTVGASGNTVGSMCMSYSGDQNAENMPLFFQKMRTQGQHFKFDDDPSGQLYIVLGVIHASTGWEGDGAALYQFNYRGTKQGNGQPWYIPSIDKLGFPANVLNDLVDDGMTLEVDSITQDGEKELANCGIYPGYGGVGANAKCNIRHTQWVEFRKVSSDNVMLASTEGLDLTEFDPRNWMHHDGRDSISVTMYAQTPGTIITETGEDPDAEMGACWETEPKEDIGLDIYYEASDAIPMVLNQQNAFDFAPINSKVFISRLIDSYTRDVDFSTTENVIVNNIHFSDNISDQAIISIISKNVNTGVTSLHKENISIGDTIHFEHSSGLKTSAIVKDYWEPIDPLSQFGDTNSDGIADSFTALTTSDTTLGVSGGPKTFKKTDWQQESIPIIISNTGNCLLPIEYEPNIGDTVKNLTISGSTLVPVSGTDFSFIIGGNITIFSLTPSTTLTSYYEVMFAINGAPVDSNQWIWSQSGYDPTQLPSGTIALLQLTTPTGYYGIDIEVWKQPVKLPWHNCWSFGNGVESDRVRDDYNAPQLDNGVKVSTTLSDYGEENIASGLIYSGLYNSTSQVNELNQFNQAEKITKELNPTYGSIQRLKTRDTDIIAFTQDKVLKILSNKDAVFNADGNQQLTATDKVLGQAIPFVGDYGISNNPESLAWDQYRMYFTDKQRGSVLRLSRDGLTPISGVGMKSWFRSHLPLTNNILGTFDSVNGEYNVTLKHFNSSSNLDTTVSFNEGAKGWVSFKSFKPSQGLSVSGNYITTSDHKIYKHHVTKGLDNSIVQRNSFYGSTMESSTNASTPSELHVLFNDMPSSVKAFRAINYEGSESRIQKATSTELGSSMEAYSGNINFDASGNPIEPVMDSISVVNFGYHNLINRSGWWCQSILTDLEIGSVPYFKNKEGKYFININGRPKSSGFIDVNEFSVQGIGSNVSYEGFDINIYNPEECVGDDCDETEGCPSGYIEYNGDCISIELSGCLDSNACNYCIDCVVADNTLCEYTCWGCMDPFAPNYDPSATNDDNTCQDYVNGCLDPTALNFNPSATQAGWVTTTPGDVMGQDDQISFIQNVWAQSDAPGFYVTAGTTIQECPSFGEELNNYVGCCSYPAIVDCDPLVDPDCLEGWTEQDCEPDNLECNCNNVFTNEFFNESSQEMDSVEIVGYYLSSTDECYGCTDSTSIYYNPNATIDCSDAVGSAGTCVDDGGNCLCCKDLDIVEDIIGCMDANACNYNVNAVMGCVDCCEYDWCTCCDNPDADNYNNLSGTYIPLDLPHPDCEFFSSEVPLPCAEGNGPEIPEFIYGCLVNTDPNYLGSDVIANAEAVGTTVLPCPEGTCSDQADIIGEDAAWCDCCAGDAFTEQECEYDNQDCCDFPDMGGCTDETAFNYDPSATIQCEPCVPFIYGCTDSSAANYNVLANTDDGSCNYTIYGCTDSSANNYDNDATVDDGSCDYTTYIYGCMDDTQWSWNPNANVNDSDDCIPFNCGCMDPNATNYNPDANTPFGTGVVWVYNYTVENNPTNYGFLNFNDAAPSSQSTLSGIFVNYTIPLNGPNVSFSSIGSYTNHLCEPCEYDDSSRAELTVTVTNILEDDDDEDFDVSNSTFDFDNN